MIKQEIGKYSSYVLEKGDMVVVMGGLEKHGKFLEGLGFERHPATGEYVGTGGHLYAMSPGDFFDRFSSRTGEDAELTAQATDGEGFFQIDGLPLVEEDDRGREYIARITAVDVETRAFIEGGVANFRVG